MTRRGDRSKIDGDVHETQRRISSKKPKQDDGKE